MSWLILNHDTFVLVEAGLCSGQMKTAASDFLEADGKMIHFSSRLDVRLNGFVFHFSSPLIKITHSLRSRPYFNSMHFLPSTAMEIFYGNVISNESVSLNISSRTPSNRHTYEPEEKPTGQDF